MSDRDIQKSDIRFTKKLMRYFGVEKLRIRHDSSPKKYPDIWLSFNHVPTISVTDEWLRHDTHTRRSQIVHEFLHIAGMEHDEAIGYNSRPQKDRFSKRVYYNLIRSNNEKSQNDGSS